MIFITATKAAPRKALPVIRRRWVETADARCPLACVWFALGPNAGQSDTTDESERPWPALLRGGQAFLPVFQQAA